MKWYGNLSNRVDENRGLDTPIEVGTKITKFLWSDRHPFEVVALQDQKHITVRRMEAKPKPNSGAYSNSWDIISNESMPTEEWNKRGNYWYQVFRHTDANGKVRKSYSKLAISIGYADYYYDYEF